MCALLIKVFGCVPVFYEVLYTKGKNVYLTFFISDNKNSKLAGTIMLQFLGKFYIGLGKVLGYLDVVLCQKFLFSKFY